MIKVLFFARIREQLGVAELDVAATAASQTLRSLKELLISQHDDAWQVVLDADNIIMAVNQAVAELDQPLADGDEVAFFPPVTGG